MNMTSSVPTNKKMASPAVSKISAGAANDFDSDLDMLLWRLRARRLAQVPQVVTESAGSFEHGYRIERSETAKLLSTNTNEKIRLFCKSRMRR